MRRAIDHLPKCRDHRASGIPDTGGAHANCGDYAVQHKRLRIRKTKVREFGQVEQLKKGAMTEIELVAVGVAAILGGAVNALAGGGTLITLPVLLAAGIPAVAANVTNTVALCPGYLGGALAQFKDLSGEEQTLYVFGITSALGGFAGGVLLLNTGEETFRVMVPYL